MRTLMNIVSAMFLLIGLWDFLPPTVVAATSEYRTVQLDIEGETFTLSAAQSVPSTSWARFHLAFGNGQSQINTAQEFDLDDPPPTQFRQDNQVPGFSAAVSVQFIRGSKQKYDVKVIVQTATREDGKWIFTREEDNTIIPPDQPYQFAIVDGSTGEELACVITIAGNDGEFLGTEGLDAGKLADVKLEICHRLTKIDNDKKERMVENTKYAAFKNRSDWWDTEFREVVPLPNGDSCYHLVTVSLTDAGFAKGASRLLGTLEIDLETIFGSDSPIGATEFSADAIRLDDFEKEVRLRNGKPVEIQIETDESSHFPFPVIESFIITAQW